MSPASAQANVPVEKNVPGLLETTLPNGKSIFCFSTVDAGNLYDEIFKDEVYGRYGVTIKDGDCVVDVGANVGLFLLYMNEKCANAKLWSFEPVPHTFEALRRNTERHNHIDAKIYRQGLSNREGTAEITFFPLAPSVSSLVPDDSEEGKQGLRDFIVDYIKRYAIGRIWMALTPSFLMNFIIERVRRYYQRSVKIPIELTTLDKLIAEEGITRIDLLKMDAEGAEYDIIPNIPDSVWPMIRQVVVETHGDCPGRKAVEDTLIRQGFKVERHQPYPRFPYVLHYARRIAE